MSRLVTYVAVILLCIGAWPPRAHAQTSSAQSMSCPTPPRLGFLTSYRFHVNAMRLISPDDRFVWDTDVGGDMDVFDFRFVRGNVLAMFEGIVGEEFRSIDPNQVNYTIDLSVWSRPGERLGELGTTFHHVSRHLTDRDKPFAIAWNMLGFQYASPLQIRSWDLDIGYRALKAIQRSFVDYTAEVGGSIKALRAVHPRVTLMLGGELTLVGVDKSERGRDHQLGARFEIGARFQGGDGVGEVFFARERRIDASPFDLEPTTFTMLGFRFLH